MPFRDISNLQQFTAVNVLSDPGHIGGPVIVPQCAQITLNWSAPGGRSAHNVLYGRYSGVFSGSVSQANAIMTALTTGATWTAVQPYLSSGGVFTGVSIRDVNTAGNALINSTNTPANGTGAGNVLPAEVAIVATLRTAKAGPSHRGRVYLTGFTIDALTAGNVILPAAVTALSNWVGATFFSALSGSGYTWVLGQPARAAYTGSTGTQHPARAATSEQITQALVRNNTWDSQRRRGLK